ncbi:MAG: DUF4252 domain-containing protein [Cruoricaptor ignavus]|nr:DUF4252 domain-containing protein [Cruoricaptor ignavus]
MKKITLIIILTLANIFFAKAQKDKLYSLFDKYQETEGVTSIKIAKPMFGMLNSLDIKDAELQHIKPMLEKIKGMRILIIENQKIKNEKEKEVQHLADLGKLSDEIAKSLNALNYEELMTVNSKGNKIKILSGEAQDGFLDDLLLNINSEGNTVLMMLDGKISMDDVNNLINENSPSHQNKSTTKATNISFEEEMRNVGKFSEIEVERGIKVLFTQGKNQQVKVITRQGEQQYLKTEVLGNVLRIFMNTKGNYKNVTVEITAPDLQKVTAGLGSNFKTTNTLSVNSFNLSASLGANVSADISAKNNVDIQGTSGANIKLNVSAKSLKTNAESGANITIVGDVPKTIFNVTSGSTVDAQNLISKDANANASSAATLKINVSENLTANADAASTIRYKGNPKQVNAMVNKNSGASIKPF